MLNPNQLAHFLQIARSASLTAAARELDVSAPALSKSLRSLERQLGSQLFDRIGRGLKLTGFGSQFVTEAAKLLGHNEAVIGWAQSAVKGQTGLVRIGCGPAALHGPVSRILAPSLSRRPDVQLQLSSGNTATLLPSLEDYSLDFLVADPGGVNDLADGGRFRITPLPQEEMVFVCGELVPAADADDMTLTELLDQRWITPRIPEHYRQVMRQRLDEEQAPRGAFRRLEALPDIQLDDINGCLQIAATAAFITATLASSYRLGAFSRSLRPLPLELRIPTNISVIQISNLTLTPVARGLIELLLDPQSEGDNQAGTA
jgi:DNA-binding transcriptional LysR family regulator